MSNLNSQALERFASTYKTGDVIFCEHEKGNEFYMLKQGRVKLMKVVGDLEKTVGILGSGDFFGEMALLGEIPRTATAIAMEDSVLLTFNKENFEVMVTSNPLMSIKLLNLFATRIHDQKRQFQILQFNDDAIRVADVLVMLSEKIAVTDNSYQRILPVNVEGVANWAGITPDAARKVLNTYMNQKRLELFPNQILVHNINDFIRLVNNKKRDI